VALLLRQTAAQSLVYLEFTVAMEDKVRLGILTNTHIRTHTHIYIRTHTHTHTHVHTYRDCV
jgi:hypothetical protein